MIVSFRQDIWASTAAPTAGTATEGVKSSKSFFRIFCFSRFEAGGIKKHLKNPPPPPLENSKVCSS